MTVKEPLKLAVGEAFIRSEQEYDGVGVIPLDCPWYICYFKGTNQAHFSSNGPDGQMLLSLTTINDSKAPPGKKGGVMAIFRSKQFETKKSFHLVYTLKSVVPVVLQSIDPNIKQQFKPFKKEKLDADLKNYETSQGGIDYKFGLLYCGKGQVSEAEMYDNTDKDVSDDYREFLNLLGDIIPLKGHTGYRAGLDVNSDTTGTHGLYTMFYSSEIMFHTATLLPHVENDAQKTEKKRHIGNDFCVLIFKEGDELVDLSTFKSHFNSIFVIVKKIDPNIIVNHSSQYLIETWRSGDVPSFEPYLPVDGSYISKEFVREFLLSTLINGQISSYSSSEMRPKMVQARELCLRNILSK
ncbi:Rap GTPase-activating protein [Entamoeba marina]